MKYCGKAPGHLYGVGVSPWPLSLPSGLQLLQGNKQVACVRGLGARQGAASLRCFGVWSLSFLPGPEEEVAGRRGRLILLEAA